MKVAVFLLMIMERLSKLIDKIDKHLIAVRNERPTDDIIGTMFRYGRKQIRIVFKESGCEIEIYDNVKGTFLDNVAFYCEPRVILWNNIEVDETTDEWISTRTGISNRHIV